MMRGGCVFLTVLNTRLTSFFTVYKLTPKQDLA